MTSGTTFGENFFPARHRGLVRRDVSPASGRIGKMKRLKLAEKCGDVCETFLGRSPENRMLPRVRNLEWLLRNESDQPVMTRQPVFGEHADVDVNADRRAGHADRI